MVFRRFRSAAQAAARAADDKIATDVLVFDVHRTSSVADYYVLVSVESSTHLTAVVDAVSRRLREDFQLHAIHQDGRHSDQWAVLDYGGLMVHILRREAREFYALERLWEGAKRMSWEEKPAPRRKPKQ